MANTTWVIDGEPTKPRPGDIVRIGRTGPATSRELEWVVTAFIAHRNRVRVDLAHGSLLGPQWENWRDVELVRRPVPVADPLEAAPAPEPHSVAANADAYFADGCGADMLQRTADLVAEVQACDKALTAAADFASCLRRTQRFAEMIGVAKEAFGLDVTNAVRLVIDTDHRIALAMDRAGRHGRAGTPIGHEAYDARTIARLV